MKFVLRSLVAGAVLLSLAAHADTYPSKPITFIVPFGPGSGTDTITRVVAQHRHPTPDQRVHEHATPLRQFPAQAAQVPSQVTMTSQLHQHQHPRRRLLLRRPWQRLGRGRTG